MGRVRDAALVRWMNSPFASTFIVSALGGLTAGGAISSIVQPTDAPSVAIIALSSILGMTGTGLLHSLAFLAVERRLLTQTQAEQILANTEVVVVPSRPFPPASTTPISVPAGTEDAIDLELIEDGEDIVSIGSHPHFFRASNIQAVWGRQTIPRNPMNRQPIQSITRGVARVVRGGGRRRKVEC